ncbi:uncharacterized protein ARMOST_17113 [Armillaria ostoyae]|uniref:Uncharacterized protein n=1 Tax=Armillaria ostoyae TaxID=47428 RepID=A0A284RY50_ARMOS|nr:uncharacterized protein ARMOST_17113 [Armillaria ostoyae]
MKSRKSLEYVREKFSASVVNVERQQNDSDSDSNSNNDEGVKVLPVFEEWHTLGVIQRRALPKTPRLYRKINFGLQHEYRGTLCIIKRSCFRVPRKSSRYIRSSLSFSPCRNYARQGGSSHERDLTRQGEAQYIKPLLSHHRVVLIGSIRNF